MKQVYWAPKCIGEPVPGVRYRLLTDGIWYYIECKEDSSEQWEGGIAGTAAFLGLTTEEVSRAYQKKK